MSSDLAWMIAIGLILIGFVGILLPAVPGVMAIFGGMLLGAWADHFQRISVLTVVILGVLTALAFVADVLGGLLGAKRVGASRLALVGAAVGSIFGLAFGFFGLVIGPFMGAVVGELIAQQRLDTATRVGIGTWVGLAIGTLAKLALAFTMLVIFVASYWWGSYGSV